jgi:acyl-CoA thioesterase I
MGMDRGGIFSMSTLFCRAFFVLIVLSGSVPLAQAAEIVALGASNTEGRGRGATPDGVPRSQAFPAQLQQMINTQGCRARVANAGIAGDTTSGMLARLPRVIGKDTRVVILQPGGNDARRGEGGNTASNIAEIERQLSQRGITMIMLDRLGAIAGSYRLADGQHFSAEGHAAFASHLLPQVMASTACRR